MLNYLVSKAKSIDNSKIIGLNIMVLLLVKPKDLSFMSFEMIFVTQLLIKRLFDEISNSLNYTKKIIKLIC
jgi:hypothetical protein